MYVCCSSFVLSFGGGCRLHSGFVLGFGIQWLVLQDNVVSPCMYIQQQHLAPLRLRQRCVAALFTTRAFTYARATALSLDYFV